MMVHSTPPKQTLVLDGDGRVRGAAAARSCDESGARAMRELTESIRRMADTLDERSRQHHLERIERTAESLTRFVADLLDVARLKEGSFPLRVKLEDVGALLRELLWRLEPSAQQHGATLNAAAIGDVPAVLIERERMLQALGNLVQNALTFTAAGGHVQVRAQQDGDGVPFALADDGCGIPAADLDHVFEPYWQQKHNGRDGAGLGLTIVRGIVEAHRGRVRVESTEVDGTASYIAIPIDGTWTAPTAAPARSGSWWPRLREFWLELRRRHVCRVAAIYASACFIVLQAADIALPALGMPSWTLSALTLAALGGTPVTVLLAWCFELKRDRGKRRLTTAAESAAAGRRVTLPDRCAASLRAVDHTGSKPTEWRVVFDASSPERCLVLQDPL